MLAGNAAGLDFDGSRALREAPFFFPEITQRFAAMIMEIELNDWVLTALERSPYINRRNLRFESDQGRVTLHGVVGTYYQKQMAQEILRRVEGVHEISNELEVSWA